MKKVFDAFDASRVSTPEPEEEEEEVKVQEEKVKPPRPPVPKRGFEVEKAENDSGVSSGGENHGDVLQPTQEVRGQLPRLRDPGTTSSVVDLFDVARNDDPFDVAQLESLDEKMILAQVFPPNNNNAEPMPTELKKPSKPPPQSQPLNVASSLQSVLAQRQVARQHEKSQNFSRSAMAALNSLPVISTEPVSPVHSSEPVATKVRHPSPSPFPAESEQFGHSLVAMGYDRIMVLKAIQLFGNDDHKCIEFLSAHADLQEAEENTATSAEIARALTVCEFSKEEARLFLQKSKRYLEMGFEHQDVRRALIRYPNEPQYVLESLMTHHAK